MFRYKREWAYTRARPLLLVEEFVGTQDEPPEDYKLFTFEGKVVAIQVDSSRFSSHLRSYYTPAWEPLEVVATYPRAPVQSPPPTLKEMIQVARQLGQEFDFIRIDLYDIEGTVYLGELTPYAGSGLEPFVPASFDEELGRAWTLPGDVMRAATRLRPPGDVRDSVKRAVGRQANTQRRP